MLIGVSVLHFLKTFLPNVAAGAEVAYQYGAGIPGGGIAVISCVGRYTGKKFFSACLDFTKLIISFQSFQGSNWNVSGTLGGSGLHLCYYQKASEQVQVGVELETNMRAQESVASLGYQVKIVKYRYSFIRYTHQ